MNIEEVREFCLSLRATTEGFPFGEDTLVFKVKEKMFLLIWLEAPAQHIAVKCNPALAVELRERYEAVEPAYHFNKKYWNDIYLERDMEREEIMKWIRHSYDEVVAKLPKRIQAELI